MSTSAEIPAYERRWWILAAVGIGTFMSALDGSVVNTVLPLIRTSMHTSVAGVEWVTTMYLLAVSALLLGVGRAGDLRGHKVIYLTGFALFALGSALCGLAPSIHILVGMRVLQGVGAAMVFANGPAILTKSFPTEQRGRALGAQATFTYLGLTAGPSLGGWLATVLGWRSVFYINVPVGIVAIVLGLRVIEEDHPSEKSEEFDTAGAFLFGLGLVALLVALNQGHAWGWHSAPTLIFLGIAAILLVYFLIYERRRTSPMLDLSLFRSRVFSAATLSALLNYICVYSVLFVIPFLLIQGRHLTAAHTGFVLSAQPLIMAIAAPISGNLSDRIGSRTPATLGMLILAGGLAVLAYLANTGSLLHMAAALAVVGLGVGIFVSPNNSALMGAAPRARQGIAAGVLATARNVGMVLGVGISAAVLMTVMAHSTGEAVLGLVKGAQASLLVAAVAALLGAGVAFVRE